ncbi:unnamed protein product, partial [Rotaria socialis]
LKQDSDDACETLLLIVDEIAVPHTLEALQLKLAHSKLYVGVHATPRASRG